MSFRTTARDQQLSGYQFIQRGLHLGDSVLIATRQPPSRDPLNRIFGVGVLRQISKNFLLNNHGLLRHASDLVSDSNTKRATDMPRAKTLVLLALNTLK